MLSAYSPTLKRPTKLSADWYRSFHTIFYLSQVTNLTLLTYIDSFIHQDEVAIIDNFKDDLIDKKIIRINDENQSYSIVKRSEFNSIHIEDTLRLVIEKVIQNNGHLNEMLLFGMGLELDGNKEKEVEVDLNSLLNATSSKNWYDALRGLLNVWEFLFLYGNIESTLKSILKKEGVANEEKLIPSIFEHFDDLEESMGVPKSSVFDLWSLYTELRNIYAHGHGLITKLAKSNLGGKLDMARKSIPSFYDNGGIVITDINGIFNKSNIQKDKFYFLKDDELNIFRNLIINIAESMDHVHQKLNG
ncbi:conserved protein of unknown function [Acidithiobacillus ferrivorans]|uniref:Uncharacterized protein n=1 Tax=Acidithiobacillus ferrivorans TaxID=160808 RepID=A0A060UST4_9PROT|nr:hypothetical protein [Acidithiobacillus ferrivorans]CDQ09848.1 conserved hypothetical protein [Acidithiobacillus ferrivorans]SMH67349.1 conserved protein of unknown function [Acidithiobacillus ferrivorans]